MLQITKRKILALGWPRFSQTLEYLNYNAVFVNWTANERVLSFPHRYAMYQDLEMRLGPITFLEFGVWKGASISKWAELNKHSESKFCGFDSFEGLPESWNHNPGKPIPKGQFDLNGKIPHFSDSRIVPIKGWFQETLPAFLETFSRRGTLVIHNDSDLYSSTVYTLAKLDPVIQSGDIIIFDEFSSPLHEFRAWTEYLNAFMRKAECIARSNGWKQAAFKFL
jgi:O-methyltransferase